MGPDGNCFFRAVSDQLFGSEADHAQLRRLAVEQLQQNREEYQFYVENDVPIDKYIDAMSQPGSWAGQLEMSILAKYFKFNVIIHRVDSEDMAQEFHPWGTEGLKTLHLAYHRRRHYNSVRTMADPGDGPATDYPIRHHLIKEKHDSKTVKDAADKENNRSNSNYSKDFKNNLA